MSIFPFDLAPNRGWTPRRLHGAAAARGFTLIELLVTMVVTLLLVLVLLQIFSSAQNSWRQSEQRVDAFREARGALQIMARDLSATLQASYAQPGGGTSTAVASLMPTLVLKHSPDITPVPNPSGPVNEEVYCLTNILNGGSGTLCAVGYFCQWMPDFTPVSSDGVDRRPRAFALMRQSLDGNATFLRIKTATSGANALTFENLFSWSGSPAPNITQIASYIWDLRFRIDTDLNDSTYPDGDAAGVPADHTSPALYYDSSQPYPPRLPAYVEIRFRALSDLAARRLEGNTSVTPSTWNDATGTAPQVAYTQIIQPNYQQFVLRVPLVNAVPLPTPTPTPSS